MRESVFKGFKDSLIAPAPLVDMMCKSDLKGAGSDIERHLPQIMREILSAVASAPEGGGCMRSDDVLLRPPHWTAVVSPDGKRRAEGSVPPPEARFVEARAFFVRASAEAALGVREAEAEASENARKAAAWAAHGVALKPSVPLSALIGKPYRIAAKSWAVGCVLAEVMMLPGERPFDEALSGAGARWHVALPELYRGLRRLRERLVASPFAQDHPVLVELVCALLHPDPARRLAVGDALLRLDAASTSPSDAASTSPSDTLECSECLSPTLID